MFIFNVIGIIIVIILVICVFKDVFYGLSLDTFFTEIGLYFIVFAFMEFFIGFRFLSGKDY